MADNFLYKIRNYGMIPNANRTYPTRSQSPFLTETRRGGVSCKEEPIAIENGSGSRVGPSMEAAVGRRTAGRL
ncbi:MAG: trehalase family glycosidase [Bryobacteraceae bacterium]